MDITDPDALLRLLDLKGRFELRVFETRGTSFPRRLTSSAIVAERESPTSAAPT
jgi:hypothetical protein